MAGLLYDLLEILEEENECCTELINMANDKTKIIIENNLNGLQELTNKEQQITAKFSKLESRRDATLKDICIVLNVPFKDFNITKLIMKLDNSEEEKNNLIKIKDDIADKVSELKKLNEKNKMLIEQSLDLVNFTLNAVRSKTQAQNNSYKYGGKLIENDSGNSLFDAKQ